MHKAFETSIKKLNYMKFSEDKGNCLQYKEKGCTFPPHTLEEFSLR